jgi:hypothetical protein
LLNWGDDEAGEWKEASSGGELFRVIGRGAKLEERQDCKKLLRIRIAVEVDGVRSEYEITYSGHARINAAVGFAYVSAGAPGGRETGAERFSALVKALTGEELKMYRMKDGRIKVRQVAPRRFRSLRRASRRRHEVARGDGSPMEELQKVARSCDWS